MKKEAEILMKCKFNAEHGDYHVATFGDHIKTGNYKESYKPDNMDAIILERNRKGDRYFFFVDPYADTLEGRRQADALEDWLSEHTTLWDVPDDVYDGSKKKSLHHCRLDRIKWCIEQLEINDRVDIEFTV